MPQDTDARVLWKQKSSTALTQFQSVNWWLATGRSIGISMLLFPSLSLLALAFDLASASVVLDGQLNISAPPAEATTRREYFYVGGEYVSDGRGGHVLQNQMYVEKLTSTVACRKLYPIVFIHGWAQTATVSANLDIHLSKREYS